MGLRDELNRWLSLNGFKDFSVKANTRGSKIIDFYILDKKEAYAMSKFLGVTINISINHTGIIGKYEDIDSKYYCSMKKKHYETR